MKKNFLRSLIIIAIFTLLLLLFKVFYPRSYGVPALATRVDTTHWILPTGSDIAYTIIHADLNKKLYPVIYLHGGPGGHITGSNIETLAPLAQNGYDVYLYDQVGSGYSNRLDDIKQYTVSRHINDLREIIKKIGAEKVILIGQSWGAILAALFAAENPTLVHKIIFTSPGPIYPVNLALRSIEAPDSFQLKQPFYTNAEGNSESANIRTKCMAYFASSFGKKLATDKEADDFVTYQSALVNRSTVCDTAAIPRQDAGYGYYAGLMTFNSLQKTADVRNKIQQLNIPVLVMKGQCDNQPWGFTNEYLQLFKNHQLALIPGAGHFIQVEQPQLYLNTIRSFLNK
ncbi:MAG TPA: alpha/beta hydrolase [Panacibacter sp.]|nr:alpha/beta hydrolase [Panacibacter sp.]HNP43472.1 alpha/beta hydrolase [Panacibacter sp.]